VIDSIYVKKVGILYHPKIDKAVAFSHELEEFLSARGILFWTCSAWEEEEAKPQIAGSELILSIGGDGTILRAARVTIPFGIPIVGINFGNLGFMTELKAEEAFDKLPQLLSGDGWIEERAMLEAELLSQNQAFHVLNDVFVGRRDSVRLVRIQVRINGDSLITYRADGILVATATGSTGYSLAAGGPILHPQSKEILLEPVCPHLTLDKALVLPTETVVLLKVFAKHGAMVSLDGQMELPLRDEDEIKVRISSNVARFSRIRPRNYFYDSLEARLKWKIQ